LLEEGPNPAGGRWWVLHTRPRQEKCLARQLYEARLPFYLPQVARRTLCRGRLLTSHVPLFPSYCFVLADEQQRIRALQSQRVVRTLEVADQERLWGDLRQVQRLIATGAPITPEGQLVAGAVVEIRTGPLAGLRGVIVRQAKQRRFVIQVDFIQRGASVELDDFMLARAV
jgi:transcriptional antiterminator RfaH